MKRRLTAFFICFLFIAGCQSKTEITFNDRSQGWQVELPYTLSYFFLEYNPGEMNSPREWIFDSILSTDGTKTYDVEEKDLWSEEFREQLLRDCYDLRYIDTGSGTVNIQENEVGTVSVCWNNDVLIMLERSTGEITCLDTRLHPELELGYVYFGIFDWMKTDPNPVLRYTFNLAEYDAPYLCWLNDNICGFYDRETERNYYYEVNPDALPIDARDAYIFARISCEERGKMGPAQLAETGGDFYVYYADTSDAFFIVTEDFVEIISREDGKLLFLSQYSYVNGKDMSVPVVDEDGKGK